MGSSGFLGKNVFNKIRDNTVYKISGKEQVDLTDLSELRDFTSELEFDYIINCAAFVGGIAYGYKYPADMLVINSRIANNVYQIAKEKSIKMLINPIPNCVYPGRLSTYKEEDLLEGPPHDSVYYYAQSKRLSISLGSSYFKQFGLSSCSVIMSNMYGPEDHFEENRSHAMGALIEKIYIAKKNNLDTVNIWGSGQQIREWLHVKDGAEALIRSLQLKEGSHVFNVGVAKGVSIIELAEIIKKHIGWNGEFTFDLTKPEGVLEKKLDGSLGAKTLNWAPSIKLEDGIRDTVEWYKKNYG